MNTNGPITAPQGVRGTALRLFAANVAFVVACATILESPMVVASSKVTATFNGTDTVMQVTWTDDGKDGGRPVEQPQHCYLGTDFPDSLKYYFNGSNAYTDSKPQQLATSEKHSCDARAYFVGVTRTYGNPFTAVIPNRNVVGQSLCFGGRNNGGYAGKFTNVACITAGKPPAQGVCVAAPDTMKHGELAAAAVNGNVASIRVGVVCTGGVSMVKVRAVRTVANPVSTVPLRADGSITTHLTVANADGATGEYLAVVDGYPSYITVKSTLTSSAPTAGSLQGTGTIIVDIIDLP